MDDTTKCAVFKDLYSAYLNEELENETKKWMLEHLNTCSNCSKWTENYKEEDLNEEYGNREILSDEESKVLRKARLLLIMGLIVVTFLALWMSLWISN